MMRHLLEKTADEWSLRSRIADLETENTKLRAMVFRLYQQLDDLVEESRLIEQARYAAVINGEVIPFPHRQGS